MPKTTDIYYINIDKDYTETSKDTYKSLGS